MKTNFRAILLFSALCIVLFSSCSKTNKEGRYIPKNAALVVLVNGETISGKLPWDAVKQNEVFKKAYQDSSVEAFMKSALDNPDNTGIDTKKDFLFFVQKDSLGGYVAMEGTIKDAAAFKKFNKEAVKGITEKEEKGISFLTSDKMTAAIEKDKFVIVFDAPQLSDLNKFSNSFDTSGSTKSSVKRNGITTCTQIFGLDEKSSLGKDAKFTNLVKKEGDIHFYMNVGELNAGSAGMAALSMLNLSKLYEGSISTAVVNFENGKINLETASYANKELTDLWKKYAGKKINTDMVSRISGKDVAVFFALNFKPEGLKEFAKLAGIDGFINMGAAFVGFNLDDFVKANKGDIQISLTDVGMDTLGKPTMNALFAASVGDKAAFGKIIDAGNKFGKNAFGGANEVFYNTSDKLFAIGNNKASVNNFIGKGGNSKFDFMDKISGHSSAAYVNFQLLFKAFEKEATKDSLDQIMFTATRNMWETLVITGGGFDDGAVVQKVELNLVDKKTNALQQLNNYLSILGKASDEKKAKRDREYDAAMSDTTEPVVEEVVEAPSLQQ